MMVFSIGSLAQTEPVIQVPVNTKHVNVSRDSNQQVSESFVMLKMDPKTRGYYASQLMDILSNDGDQGGRVQAGIVAVPDLSEYAFFTITATKEMLSSIRGWLDQTAKGDCVNDLDYFTYRLEANGRDYSMYYSNGTDRVFYPIKSQPPEFLAGVVKGALSRVGSVSYNDELMVISDNPVDLVWIMEALERYDVPSSYELVQVIILETEKGFETNIGLHWGAFKKALPAGIDMTFSQDPWLEQTGGLRFNTMEAFVNNINPRALAGFFNFLASEGIGGIKVRKTLRVGNKRESTCYSGRTYSYRTSQDGKTFQDLSVKDGVSLTLGAEIGKDHTTLNVDAKYQTLVSLDPDGQHLPVFDNHELKTSIQVEPDKIYVLSGNNSSIVETSSSGAPFLRRIPGLKKLASRSREVRKSKDIYILIRAIPQDEMIKGAKQRSDTIFYEPLKHNGPATLAPAPTPSDWQPHSM